MNKRDDLFIIQIRLFRLAQLKWNKTAEECEKIFKQNKIFEYIATCYEIYHVQGDDANLADIEKYLENNDVNVEINKDNSIVFSKYEYSMQLLAAMASANIAKEKKISKTNAFLKFIKSQTGQMLFDESTDMWMNGPDYISDEYRREMGAK